MINVTILRGWPGSLSGPYFRNIVRSSIGRVLSRVSLPARISIPRVHLRLVPPLPLPRNNIDLINSFGWLSPASVLGVPLHWNLCRTGPSRPPIPCHTMVAPVSRPRRAITSRNWASRSHCVISGRDRDATSIIAPSRLEFSEKPSVNTDPSATWTRYATRSLDTTAISDGWIRGVWGFYDFRGTLVS